ncbi:MAG: cytochrome c family protein [Sphingopyxis terrae]|nr:cytochrome c family protein [Sphingopyxis terrae]
MNRPALAAALLLLTACGDGGGTAAEPSASPVRPASTDAEKAALLASLPAPYASADLDNGRRVFARCRACHTITEGGPNMTGPNLYGVFGREAGHKDGYNYSTALREAEFTWDAGRLDHWLENPREFLRGNKMSFPGIADAEDRRDLIAFLKVETGYASAPVE